MEDTLQGERLEIYPFLGSYLLAEAIDGGSAATLADECVVVPCRDYGIVEDIHLILNHTLVGYFQRRLKRDAPSFGA